MLCINCGCSQLSPCARSAKWASEIWEELSHFPSYVSSGREQAQGSPSSTVVNNFQLNSGPAPDLEIRRRGPQVAVTVTGNECLTRGPRPAPSDASRRKATQGRWRIPVPAEIPNLGTCRVIVPLIGTLTRQPLIRRADSQVR